MNKRKYKYKKNFGLKAYSTKFIKHWNKTGNMSKLRIVLKKNLVGLDNIIPSNSIEVYNKIYNTNNKNLTLSNSELSLNFNSKYNKDYKFYTKLYSKILRKRSNEDRLKLTILFIKYKLMLLKIKDLLEKLTIEESLILENNKELKKNQNSQKFLLNLKKILIKKIRMLNFSYLNQRKNKSLKARNIFIINLKLKKNIWKMNRKKIQRSQFALVKRKEDIFQSKMEKFHPVLYLVKKRVFKRSLEVPTNTPYLKQIYYTSQWLHQDIKKTSIKKIIEGKGKSSVQKGKEDLYHLIKSKKDNIR